MVEKSFDALRILETAKEVELRGITFYKEAAEAVSDGKVKDTFLALAADEARHLSDLENIRVGLEKAFPTLSQEAVVSDQAKRFRDLLFPEIPSEILSDTRELTGMQALGRGIQLEQDSIKLYEDAAEREVNPGASTAFRKLVMEERIHLFVLNQRRDLLKMRS